MAEPSRIVLDGNVLFSAALRDTFLWAAQAGLCQIFWSEEMYARGCPRAISRPPSRTRTESACFQRA